MPQELQPPDPEQAFEAIWQAFLLGVSPRPVVAGLRDYAHGKFIQRMAELVERPDADARKDGWLLCSLRCGAIAKALVHAEERRVDRAAEISKDDFDKAVEIARELYPPQAGDICA